MTLNTFKTIHPLANYVAKFKINSWKQNKKKKIHWKSKQITLKKSEIQQTHVHLFLCFQTVNSSNKLVQVFCLFVLLIRELLNIFLFSNDL